MERNSNILRDQLLSIRYRFLSALTLGDDALSHFDLHWNTLITQVTIGIEEGWLQEDILRLVHDCATFIAASIDAFTVFEESTSSIVVDIDRALANLTLNDPACSSNHNQVSTPSNYIPAALDWLLDNLHNPYPSSDTKQLLATRSGLSVRDIHEWFKEIRRSIGWIDLCKRHFQGSRALAVEAATHVLQERGSSAPVPPEVEMDILSLQGTAECLYPEHHTSSWVDYPSRSPFLRYPRAPKRSMNRCFDSNSSLSSGLWTKERYTLDVGVPSISNNDQDVTSTKTPESSNPLAASCRTSRKRRFSDTDHEATRKRSRTLPNEPRRHVSDPLPDPSISQSVDLDSFWKDLLDPSLPSLITDTFSSGPVTIVPKEWDPPISDEQIAALSSLWENLKPDNERLLAPLAMPEATPSQDYSHTLPFIDSQPFDGTFPFADPSLTMDPIDPLDTSATCEDIFSTSSAYSLGGFAGLADSSSDTSSILTLSPPRTPVVSPSPNLSSESISIPPLNEEFGDFASSTLSFSILEDILREKDFEKNSTVHTSSLTESLSSSQTALSTSLFSNLGPASLFPRVS